MGFMSNAAIRRTKAEQLEGVQFAGKPKKIAHNTLEYTRTDGTRVIRLHLTDIVEFLPDGSVRLSTGGFKTHTTKDRLNQYLPKGWSIWAEKGLWYVGQNAYSNKDAQRYVFSDGITFKPDGSVDGVKPDEAERCLALAKKISKFCKELAKLPKLPVPDGGDCWSCMGIGSTRGDYHLEEHLDEMYIHGTLIVNAMRWAKCSDYVIAAAFKQSNPSCLDHAHRAVRRYL